MAITGAYAFSYSGMLPDHFAAIHRVAAARNEVIIVRPVNIWVRRLLQEGFPTKGFHLKAKSSDWGPQCGFICAQTRLSKVRDQARVANNDAAIQQGRDHYQTVDLKISKERIKELATATDPETGRSPIKQSEEIGNGAYYILSAPSPLTGQEFVFLAKREANNEYSVYESKTTFTQARKALYEGIKESLATPLTVFAANIPGVGLKPLTADYDLFAVCPAISARYAFGGPFDQNADSPLVPLHLKSRPKFAGPPAVVREHVTEFWKQRGYREDPGHGNWPARVRECVQALNAAVNRGAGLECVHHNADILSPFPQGENDLLPATVFLPGAQTWYMVTDISELKLYLKSVHHAGYFVPRNALSEVGLPSFFDLKKEGFLKAFRRAPLGSSR